MSTDLTADQPSEPERGPTPQPFDVSPPVLFDSRALAIWVGQHLANHNPFYPLSAVLILLGLHNLFQDEKSVADLNAIGFNNAILWCVLAGYATVLSATSVWLIRWGKVWDDARTILLTLVLLLVAMSVNCDKPISLHVTSAPQFLFGGLCFAILLTEATVHFTRIRLPWFLRLPMHLYFGLFFLYPIGLDYCLNTLGDINNAQGLNATLFGVLMFPTAAAAVTLTLLPAAARGPSVVRLRMSPWTWPSYPWSLFVVLGIAVVLRAFYLTISFHPRSGTDSAFAPYFVTPLAMAVAAVAFELGRSVRHRLTQDIALLTPLLWLPFSLTGEPACYKEGDFLCLHMQVIGAPLQVTIVGLVLLYAYAWWRRGPAWLGGGIVSLLTLGSIAGPGTVSVTSFGPVRWELLALAAIVAGYAALRHVRSSWRWTIVATLAVASATVAGWDHGWSAYRGALPVHLWVAAITLIGMSLRDDWSGLLRHLSRCCLVGLAFGGTIYSARSVYGLSPTSATVYVVTLTLIAWSLWAMLRSPDQFAAALLVSLANLLQFGLVLRIILMESEKPFAWSLMLGGTACFLTGIGISAWKMSRPHPDGASHGSP